MRLRLRSVLYVAALASFAVVACNKPDPNATQPDAAYTETVTTASAGATALPPGNAPGGDPDATAPSVASASASASASGSAAATGLVIAKPTATPTSFGQACGGGSFGNVAPSATPAAPIASAPASASASASSAAAAPACGDKPLPACPMTAWMKANAGPAATNADSDLPTLATVLDKIATFAPPGYANWTSISKDGAAAARAGQLDAARASCRSCHTQYKAKYKAEIRSRPLP